MNTEIIVNLRKQVEELSSQVTTLTQLVNAMKINEQQHLNANHPIPPGIACKVAFDKKGLIVNGTKLETTDIPELEIDKIINLKNILNDKASSKDLSKFKNEVTEMIKPISEELGEVTGTGTKVNYNKDGRIISSVELLASDIPTLPIAKIQGLEDIIASMNISKISVNSEEKLPTIKTNAGSFTKVTIDQHGRVLSGNKLDIDDIPNILISKINHMESSMANLASQKSVDGVSKSLSNKLDSNPNITSGTYTKLKVDSKGLVVKGDQLTIRDLPELNISNIVGLDKSLKEKADRIDLINLNDTVSALVNSLSMIGEVSSLKNELKSKASDNDLSKLNSRIESMQRTLDMLLDRLPGDMILEQFSQIERNLSDLECRIANLEKNKF